MAVPDEESLRKKIYAAVRKIPRGRVATYGQIAALAGRPRAPRAPGRALATLPRPMARVLPWWRVVSASGAISRRERETMTLQRELLESEGVPFRGRWRVDLARVRWTKGVGNPRTVRRSRVLDDPRALDD